MVDPFNPTGSTMHVRFNTSKTNRWETDPRNKMILQVAGETVPKSVHESDVNPATDYIRKRFGESTSLLRIAASIWKMLESSPNCVFRLSDVAEVSRRGDCTNDEALAVLGLLSASSAKILRMEFRSDEKGQLVEPSDFISKLRDWWRDKVMDDKGWERWSSHVTVNWVAAHSNEDRALFYPFFGGGG